jgi:hypothetical protein
MYYSHNKICYNYIHLVPYHVKKLCVCVYVCVCVCVYTLDTEDPAQGRKSP